MQQSTRVVLLATFATVGAWSADFSAFSTTMVQMTKQDTPGFSSSTYAPVTEFLGIDATQLGTEGLSMHLFGWGYRDLGNAGNVFGQSYGDLSYAYLDYHFNQANAQLKAGRFSITQGGAVEQVDGVSGRTDLRGGFNLSAFVGAPVLYKTQPTVNETDYRTQNDFIFGSRLGLRLGPVGEVGVSYVQEGTKRAQDYPAPQGADFTRKQLGTDVRLAPAAKLEITGHTLLNLEGTYQAPGTATPTAPRLAENDYAATYRFAPTVALTGTYTERNLQSYYAGTNLPNLFRLDEKDRHRAFGGNLALGSADAVEVTLDYRQTKRETYGIANRYGADVRWAVPDTTFKAGGGLHRVSAADAPIPGTTPPTVYGLSRNEVRAWVMYLGKGYNASLDGIIYHFDDDTNPNLNGKSSLAQLVASLGVNPTANLSVSGDLSVGTNAYYQREVSALLRTTYRFSASKGGK